MARRERDAKQLAQRIDLEYLKKPHPLRRWRFWLSVSAPALALVWILGIAVAGRRQPYSSGPLSSAHAVFGARCEVCHVQTLGFFRQHVRDAVCLECHDGPVHQANQTFTPTCVSCHLEHRGAVRLAEVRDATCTQCHAGLRVSAGETKFVQTIRSFQSDHPEFAAMRGKKDPGAIKLNHKIHLKPGLRGPKGPVQLECWDCHRPLAVAVAETWKYGAPGSQTAQDSTPPGKAEPASSVRPPLRNMAPPEYAKACAGCHTLRFDAHLPDEVPHGKPELIAGFLRARYREVISRNPGELRRAVQIERRLPDAPAPPAPPRDAAEWVRQQADIAETLLWRKTCAECHSLTPQANGPPQVAPAAITAVWMLHARFHHESHRLLTCTACHAVAESEETADLLLPGIATCRQCHIAGQESAGDSCSLCHTYHDWSQQKRPPSRFGLEQLLKGN